MQKIVYIIYKFSHRFIQVFSCLLAVLLLLGSFLTTCYSTDMTSQIVLTRWDHPLLNLAGTALFTGIILLAARFLDGSRKTFVLTALVLLWTCAIGAVLIIWGNVCFRGRFKVHILDRKALTPS